MTNKAIVLLPGLNGTDGLFQPLIDSAPAQYDVISISYPTHQKMSYSELKNYVLKRLETINTPYILLGESFSGPLSLMLGQVNPEKLAGIVLVATFVTAPNLKIGRLLPWRLGFTLTRPLYGLRMLCSSSKNKGFINSISTELQKVCPRVLAHRIQSVFSVNAIEELKDCKVPIIYFRGRNDFVVPAKNLQLIRKNKPDIKVAYFDTQHFLLQTKPEQAWCEISSFIDAIDAKSH